MLQPKNLTELSKEEERLVQLGSVRFNKRLDRLNSLNKVTGPGYRLISTYIGEVSRIIEQSLEMHKQKPLLTGEQMAFIGLSTVVSNLEPETKMHSLSLKIGNAIQDEYNAQLFNVKEGLDRQDLIKELRKHDPVKKSKSYLIRQGVTVLDAIEKSTDLIIFSKIRINKRTYRIVSPTEKYINYHTDFLRENQYLEPLRRPITVYPIQVDSNLVGGYAFDVLSNTSVLRYKDKEQLTNSDTDRISNVLNTIQSVPYEIDKEVLDVAWRLYTTSKGVAGLPPELEDLPKKEEDEDEKVFLSRYHKVKRLNNSILGKRFNTARTLTIAQEFKDEDHFYFPVYVDFRGRVYPSGDYLSYQGNDLSKSLLQFKSKKKIDDIFFYYVHIANTAGMDKLSYVDRVNWVKRNKENIIKIASDPMGNIGQWSKADSPFAFLASCFDANRYWKDPDNYESGLRCSVDATASGLQILSLLARDKELAGEVNVLDTGSIEPKDIYSVCRDGLLALLENDSKCNIEPVSTLSNYWLNFFKGRETRSLVKRILMCKVYSLSPHGVRAYVNEWIRENRKVTQDDLFREDNYLVKRVTEAVNNASKQANKCMEEIKKVSVLSSERGEHLELTLPSGFHMISKYNKTKPKLVRTLTKGYIYNSNLSTETSKIQKLKSSNASVPNVIHSIDASILYTFVESLNLSVPVSLVHDSIFYRAGDVDEIYEKIRQAYIKTFSVDILNNLNEQNNCTLGIERGEIDLTEIEGSPYIWH